MSLVYLDNASTTIKKPFAVKFAMLKNYANAGRGGYNEVMKSSFEISKTRDVIANFFGFAHPERVVFAKNATEAINTLILGYVNEDDHIIMSGMEHNSVGRCVVASGADYSVAIPDKYGRVSVKAIEEQVKPSTKLIVITHASNVVGTINPIKSIGKFARENNIAFMVDAAQTAGIVDINMERDNIDMLAVPGHKHLFGPFGTGFAIIGKDIEIRPLTFGGTGSGSGSLVQVKDLPEGLESGTLNITGIVSLRKAVEFINKIGIKNIIAYEKRLTRYLIDNLKTIPNIKIYGSKRAKDRVGIVSFNIGNFDSVEVGNVLAKESIAVRCGLHCSALCHTHLGTLDTGTVRASLSWWNDKRDIKKLIATLKHLQ